MRSENGARGEADLAIAAEPADSLMDSLALFLAASISAIMFLAFSGRRFILLCDIWG